MNRNLTTTIGAVDLQNGDYRAYMANKKGFSLPHSPSYADPNSLASNTNPQSYSFTNGQKVPVIFLLGMVSISLFSIALTVRQTTRTFFSYVLFFCVFSQTLKRGPHITL